MQANRVESTLKVGVWLSRNVGDCEDPAGLTCGGSTDTESLELRNDIGTDGWSDLHWSGHGGAARVLQCRAVSESMNHCSQQRFFSSLQLFSLVSASILRRYKLCGMEVHQESCSWACSLQVPDRLHCLRSLAIMSFHHHFCPQAACLPLAGVHTRSCLGSRSSGILERCLRK